MGGRRLFRDDPIVAILYSARAMTLGEFTARLPKGDLWVFGYGSLMWSSCFDYTHKAPALAHGYHRALCILSTRYRGTERKPGLVMGLCRGGSCWGMAYRVDAPRLRRARLVAQGIGVRGPCVDYIRNTLEHMQEVGVRDPHLERILHAAIALRQNGSHDSRVVACAPPPPAARQPEARAAGAVLRRA